MAKDSISTALTLDNGKARICVEIIHQQHGKLLAAGGQTEKEIPWQFETM